MKIIRGLENIKRHAGKTVCTIGVFDGVHLGHAFILRKTKSLARAHRSGSAVITFHPNPAKVLYTRPMPSLISLAHRLDLIGSFGIDECIVLNFTKSFSQMRPEDFVVNHLVRKLNVSRIVIGSDFRFGKRKTGDIDILRAMAKRYDFKVNVVRPKKARGLVISSTLIRGLIKIGELSKAEKLLGRPVSILGTVVRGIKFARFLGYPTANINPHHEARPPSGVYAVEVRIADKRFGGVLNIGSFFDKEGSGTRQKDPKIEVHVFDCRKGLYDKDIQVSFVRKIRDESRFTSLTEAREAISQDVILARKVLAKIKCEK